MAVDPSALRTLDTDDLKRILRSKEAKVLKLLNSRAIPAAKVGNRWLVTEADLLAFLERSKQPLETVGNPGPRARRGRGPA